MQNDLTERIKELSKAVAKSQTAFADRIGVSQSTLNRNLRGGDYKLVMELTGFILLALPEVSRKWLFFGEGEMLQRDTPKAEQTAGQASGSITPFPVPVVGLASCGVEGIEQVMPYAVSASPIHLGPRSVAVVASGESMVPAGIASGQICFCDPDQKALPGEAVFLRKKDDKGALKLFLGPGKGKGHTAFMGWLSDRDEQGHQKEFLAEFLDMEIDYIAPVVFIRRRL